MHIITPDKDRTVVWGFTPALMDIIVSGCNEMEQGSFEHFDQIKDQAGLGMDSIFQAVQTVGNELESALNDRWEEARDKLIGTGVVLYDICDGYLSELLKVSPPDLSDSDQCVEYMDKLANNLQLIYDTADSIVRVYLNDRGVHLYNKIVN